MTRRAWVAFAVLTISSLTAMAADDGTRLLRFPDIHGDTVVFCYGGDLWSASTDGGTATRLTAHPGQEVFPRFSPDGSWIAFTGQYDGDEQVYVIPATGGEPTRLTWYPAEGPLPPRWGYDNQVFGWTPDGTAVLFRSLRDAGGGSEGRLYTVSVDRRSARRRCPCRPRAPVISRPTARRWSTRRSSATSATGSATRAVGRRISIIFDLDDLRRSPPSPTPSAPSATPCGSATRSTSSPTATTGSTSTRPTRRPARSSSSPRTTRGISAGRPPTHRAASSTNSTASSGSSTSPPAPTPPSPSRVPDDGLWKRPRRISVAGDIGDFGLSPKGERALFVARGEVFSAPVEKGTHPQPDPLLRRQRPGGGVVARRRSDRLHLRRRRRGRDLASSTRTAPSPRGSSPTATRPGSSISPGRPTATASPSPTISAGSRW